MKPSAEGGLKRTLSLWQVTMSGVGLVIGAGIYVIIGDAAAEAGNAVWLAFLVAALMSALTGLSYAELASMFPSAAAEYEFARQAFSEFWGFVAGWAMLAAYVIAAPAVAIGFGHYLGHFFEVDYRLAALGLLTVLTLIVISGLEHSIWLTAALVVLQVGGLLLVIAAGVPHIGQRDLIQDASIGGVLGAASLVFFAFIGFDDIVTLSEDTKNPERIMPKAVLLTLGISTLLYVLVGICAVSVVGGQALAASDRPLALVMSDDWGASAGDIVAFIALAATTNTTLIILTAASRIVYGMAKRGSLPVALAGLGKGGRSPSLASALVLLLAAPLALWGNLELVASATDFMVYVVFLLVNLAVIVLRFRLPPDRRQAGFVIPGRIGRVPPTAPLAIFMVVVMVAFLEPIAWLLGAAFLLSGCLLHVLLSRKNTSPAHW